MGHPSFCCANYRAQQNAVAIPLNAGEKCSLSPRPRSFPPVSLRRRSWSTTFAKKRALNEREEREVLVCRSQRRLRVQFGFAVYLDTFLDEKVEIYSSVAQAPLPPHQPGQQGEVKGHAQGQIISLYLAHHLGIRLQLARVLLLLLSEKCIDSGCAMACGFVVDDP
jgi:hypothetical protein